MYYAGIKFEVIFTMPGHDKGFLKITKIIKGHVQKIRNFHLLSHLVIKNYLNYTMSQFLS